MISNKIIKLVNDALFLSNLLKASEYKESTAFYGLRLAVGVTSSAILGPLDNFPKFSRKFSPKFS